jgi:hypothetical protein
MAIPSRPAAAHPAPSITEIRVGSWPDRDIQFSKAVLRGMGLTHLAKNAKVIKELAKKGIAPD